MEAKEFDFEFPRGDTCPVSFEITDNDGNPLDLTGSEIYFTLKKNYTTSSAIIQKKLTSGTIEVDGNQGSLVLTHDDTAELKYGSYVYDIQIKTGNYVKTLALGKITLTNESTWKSNE